MSDSRGTAGKLRQKALGFAISTLLLLGVVGCAQQSPVEKMEWIRGKYEANINGFYVQPLAELQAEADAAETPEGEEAEPSEELVPDDDMAAALAAESAPDGPVPSRAVIDFTVRTDSADPLPGVTVDITMGNAGGEKERWTVWVDTSSLGRGPGTQITHTIEEVQFEEGDGFHVEIRHPIPEGERNAYREYADVG